MNGFLKAAANTILKSEESVSLSGFQNLFSWPLAAFEPFHYSTSGLQENQQELVSLFVEGVSKTNFKYIKNYGIKNWKTISGPTEITHLIL